VLGGVVDVTFHQQRSRLKRPPSMTRLEMTCQTSLWSVGRSVGRLERNPKSDGNVTTNELIPREKGNPCCFYSNT
jgi:hypothetical protein